MPLLFSFLGMTSAASSYLMKKKWQFLVAQGMSILLIAISNLYLGLYYACISSLVSFSRVLVYYDFERKDKEVPHSIKLLFVALVIISYVITNIIILKNTMWQDLMLMAINCSFVYIVGIRNIKVLRYCMVPPILLAILYCILMKTAVFTTFSYVIELVANLVAIVIYSKSGKIENKVSDQ